MTAVAETSGHGLTEAPRPSLRSAEPRRQPPLESGYSRVEVGPPICSNAIFAQKSQIEPLCPGTAPLKFGPQVPLVQGAHKQQKAPSSRTPIPAPKRGSID